MVQGASGRWWSGAVVVIGSVLMAGTVGAVGATEPPVDDGPAAEVAPVPEAAPAPTNRVIVKSRAGEAASEAAISQAAGTTLTPVVTLGDGAVVFALPEARPATEVATVAAAIARLPQVEYAEPDVLLTAQATPNDPNYGDQWHYRFATSDWGANLPGAWDVSTGTNVVVAVVDTGRLNHPDLNGKLLDGVDMISDTAVANDGNGRDTDEGDPGTWAYANQCYPGSPTTSSNWHGTLVAGTIGAVANNGIGGSGVSWGARILHVRVIGRCGGYVSDIADGIRWAAGLAVPMMPTNTTAAKVINLSVGAVGPCETTMRNAINAAVGAGAVVVAAAGNNAANAAQLQPANCDNVIAVAAGDREGNLASYSNFSASIIDLTAPGGETSPVLSRGVFSAVNAGTQGPSAMSYGFRQGTSVAAPHVSGVLALMKGHRPNLTPAQLTSRLLANLRPFKAGTSCATQGICGRGWLDAERVMRSVAGLAPLPTISIGDVSISEGSGGGTRNMNFQVTLSATSTRTVSVRYATEDGFARAPEDYVAVPPTTLTFLPGQVSKTISVRIKRDSTFEVDEHFLVHLSSAVNVQLPADPAVGTILDDD